MIRSWLFRNSVDGINNIHLSAIFVQIKNVPGNGKQSHTNLYIIGSKNGKGLTIFIANACCLSNSVLLTDSDSSNKKTISAQSMQLTVPTIKLWNYWPNILELGQNKSKTKMFTTKHTLERLYAGEDWFSIVFCFFVHATFLSFLR